MIHFSCECGQRMTADDEHGGMIAECPQCKLRVQIPQLGVEADGAVGADLMDVPVAVPVSEAPAESVGDEAMLFAEQMGLEVEEPAAEPQTASAVSPEADAEAYDLEAAEELGLEQIDTSPTARAARAKQSQAASQRRAQHQFKRAAIPLMLTMSGLLLVFAIWSVIDLATGATAALRDRAILMMASWPVILILLFGAWWFRRDIRRSEQG